jgi:hypothetical protein
MIWQSYLKKYHWQSARMRYVRVGAPEHFSRAVRDVLSNTYHDRCIGRGGPTAWLPRSSDLNLWNFTILPVGTPKNPCVCSSCWQRRGTSLSHCGCLSDYPQLPPVSLSGCGVDDIWSAFYKCTLLAITHKLNVSGHMLIWTIFFFWCVKLPPRVCPLFSITLCIRYWRLTDLF